MKIYVYTNTPKGGLKEYRATISQFSSRNKVIAIGCDSHKWWVGLSEREGVVKGQSVWFKEPSYAKAKELFQDKDMDRAIGYIDRSRKAYERAMP